MQSFRIPILLSLLVHILFIGLFAFLMNNVRLSSPRLDNLTVILSSSESESPLIERKQDNPQQSTEFPTPASTIPVIEVDRVDATPPSQTDKPEEKAWASFLKEGEARITLLQQETDNDSAAAEQNRAEITMRPLRIAKSKSGQNDLAADEISKRNAGALPFLMKLNPTAETKRITVRPPSLDFVPSHTQLACLSRLMDEDSLTDTELYPLLGGAGNTSFENFQKEMDLLTEKGLVVREKVSPIQAFSFFGFPIEMSGKNRRNPEFRYKPHLSRKKLYTFLEARLYGAKEQLRVNPADSVRIQQQINVLMEKIALIRPVAE